MADITMCVRESCPLADSCYRKLATPDPLYQSYSEFTPAEFETGCYCEFYWEVK